MQLKNLLAFLAAASAVQASTDFVEDFMEEDALENRSSACTKGVHIVAAGGEGSVKGTLGYLQSLVDDIRNAIPGSNLFQAGYSPGADPGTSIGQGVSEINAHLRKYVKKCPKSKIALVGYSVGGAAVTDVLCGDVYTGEGALPNRFRKHVVASIVYGDPTFLPGKSYDRGTCTGQGASDVPRQKPGACFPFGNHLRSYCDYNDPECCGGNDPNVHFEYPGLYDAKATAYVKKRWQQSKN